MSASDTLCVPATDHCVVGYGRGTQCANKNKKTPHRIFCLEMFTTLCKHFWGWYDKKTRTITYFFAFGKVRQEGTVLEIICMFCLSVEQALECSVSYDRTTLLNVHLCAEKNSGVNIHVLESNDFIRYLNFVTREINSNTEYVVMHPQKIVLVTNDSISFV